MRLTFFATCAPGVEPYLHAEARELKLAKLERQVGGVRFEGTLSDAWRANLWLRTAVRVLLRLDRFQAEDEDALYAGVQANDWSRWLSPSGTLWVDAQTKESRLDHSQYIAQRVKDAVVDQLRTPAGERPQVERDAPDLRLHLHLWRGRATLSVDTSGESLHKRGWRRAQGRAPLAETLAAAMLLASGWDRRAPLIDPFCGSGTLLVEAGMLAAGAPPGGQGRRFAFESFPDHDAQAWAAMRDQALAAAAPQRKLRLVGYDIESARLNDARENLAAVGLAELTTLERADARQFAPRPGWNGWVVSNLPYGERVGSTGQARDLARAFGERLRGNCAGYHAALLLGDDDQADALGLAQARRGPLVNGGLDCRLVLAEL
jgi:23S rRNA G2445 N2-methylase RlmL